MHELKLLGESLRRVASGALCTIEADMAAWIRGARDAASRVTPAPDSRPEPLARHLPRELAAMRSLWTTIEQQINTLAALNVDIKEARTTLPPIEANDVGCDAARDLRGAVHGAAGRRAEQSTLDRRRAACLEAVVRVKDLIDRVRTAVDESLAGVVRAVRTGADAPRRADRSVAAAARAFHRAGDALDRGP